MTCCLVLIIVKERGSPHTGHASSHRAGLLSRGQRPLAQLRHEGGDQARHPLGTLRQHRLAELVTSWDGNIFTLSISPIDL